MRILTQMQSLDDALRAWERYRAIPREVLERDQDTQYMVCHAMLLAIQSTVDIATGIAVDKTPRRPATYRETFLVLGASGIIPEDLARDMSRLAGFRNILVHEYSTLDISRVYAILQEDQKTVQKFRDCAGRYVKEDRSGN